MRPSMVVPVALLTALLPASAPATVPQISAPDAVVLSPGARFPANPIGSYTVHVEGATGPIAGSFVELEFSAEADALVSWCTAPFGGVSGQVHPILSGFTDANGNTTFEIYGGGCLDPSKFYGSTFLTQLRVDGIVAEEPYVCSPDAVDRFGKLATDEPPLGGTRRCDPDGPDPGTEPEANVQLSDAVFHTPAIKMGLHQACTKFTPPFNGPVGLSDAAFLTPYIKTGSQCNCQ